MGGSAGFAGSVAGTDSEIGEGSADGVAAAGVVGAESAVGFAGELLAFGFSFPRECSARRIRFIRLKAATTMRETPI